MAPLSHPSIHDGWFREISSQWEGQAMTLKVTKILHVEKSKYQDVLVFESATYGNVLVLDGVIQCTERDEFSYQEMIAHIPMNAHPNPKNVLVIGGGDGGVVREVLKHPSVEKVVLCDIDEAVIRVSKQYLPHMSSLLSSPRVEVFVGDGFQFLKDHQGTYDVIITDSSDPVGPAESLFQKDYFQLLHDALTEEGNISTQGECLWLHLPLITNLKSMTSQIFPVSEYAYTTIPTYPSGQIGFMVCSKGKDRDFRTPLRTVSPTRYYNNSIHKSAFVLPEFARVKLEEGKDIRPKFGREALASAQKEKKKILLLGSGYVAKPCVEYLARDPFNYQTIACRTLSAAQQLAESVPNATPISLDVKNTTELEKAVAEHDIVISLIPYIYHADVVKAAIKGKTNVVTTSYVSPALQELDEEAKAAGIWVMNEIGLDPGIDHLYAVKTISEVHEKGGKVNQFFSFCGGLPAPECANNPLGYKFSWSSRGVLLALLNQARLLSEGKEVTVEGKDLMGYAKPIYISPAFAFVGYPNRDSVPFREKYAIEEAKDLVRGTLRYQGFPEFVKTLVGLGWLDAEEKDYLLPGSTSSSWAEVTQKVLGADDSSESTLVQKIKSLSSFPSPSESERIISGLRWIGLFSSEPIKPYIRTQHGKQYGNLLDTLCARFEELMKYEQGERDLVMLQHKFGVVWKDGKEDTLTSTLEWYGSTTPGGHSAMSFLVGIPCGIATQMILDGELQKVKGYEKGGIQAPYGKELCEILRKKVESEGIGMVEKVL